MFVLYPSLLFESVTALGLISGLVSATLGVICLAAASIGYFAGPLKLWKRVVLLSGVFLLILTSAWTDVVGILIIAFIYLTQKHHKKEEAKL